MTATRRLVTAAAGALLLAAAIVLIRQWVLPTFGDYWADVLLIGSTAAIAAATAITLVRPIRNRIRGRHRKPSRLKQTTSRQKANP